MEDNLTCSICSEKYDLELRTPKILHEICSFCSICLKDLPIDESIVICPECHVKIKLGKDGIEGLKEDHSIIPLIKMYTTKSKDEAKVEDIDSNTEKDQPAELPQYWCTECNAEPEHACHIMHDVLPALRAKAKMSEILASQKAECIDQLNHSAKVMSDIRKVREQALQSVQAIQSMLVDSSVKTLSMIESVREKARLVESLNSDDFEELVKLGDEVENIKLENLSDLNEANRIGAIYRQILQTEATVTFSPLMSSLTLSIPMHLSSTVHRSQIYKNLMTLCCLQEIVDNNMMGVTKKDIAQLYTEKGLKVEKKEEKGGKKKMRNEDIAEDVESRRLETGLKELSLGDTSSGAAAFSDSEEDSVSVSAGGSSQKDQSGKESGADVGKIIQKKKKKNKGKGKNSNERPLQINSISLNYAGRDQKQASQFLLSDRPYNDVFPSTFAGYPPAGMGNPHQLQAKGRGRAALLGQSLDNHYTTMSQSEASYGIGQKGFGQSATNGWTPQGAGFGRGRAVTPNMPGRNPGLLGSRVNQGHVGIPRNPESKIRIFLEFTVDGRSFGCVIFVLDKIAAPKMVENFVALCNSSRYPTYRHSRVVQNHPDNYIMAGEMVKDESFSSFGGLFAADFSPLPDCIGAIRMKCVKVEGKKVLVANLFNIWAGEREFKRFPTTSVFGRANPDGMDTISRLSKIDSWKADIRINNCGLA